MNQQTTEINPRDGEIVPAARYVFYPIEKMKDELVAAGWTAKSPTVWTSPDGKLFRGPYGAWRMLKGAGDCGYGLQRDLTAA